MVLCSNNGVVLQESDFMRQRIVLVCGKIISRGGVSWCDSCGSLQDDEFRRQVQWGAEMLCLVRKRGVESHIKNSLQIVMVKRPTSRGTRPRRCAVETRLRPVGERSCHKPSIC